MPLEWHCLMCEKLLLLTSQWPREKKELGAACLLKLFLASCGTKVGGLSSILPGFVAVVLFGVSFMQCPHPVVLD